MSSETIQKFVVGQRLRVKDNAVSQDRVFAGRTGIFLRYTTPHGYAKIRMERYARMDRDHATSHAERRQEVLSTYTFHPESLEPAP